MYFYFRKIVFALLVSSLLLGGPWACGNGSPTSTPPVPVFGDFVLGVAVSTPTSSASIPQNAKNSMRMNSVSFQSDGIRVDETRNVVSDISFEPVSGGGGNIEFNGMYVVELITKGSVVNKVFPEFGLTQIPFTSYKQFVMKFAKIDSKSIPSALLADPVATQYLLDHSVVIEGSFIEAGKDIDHNGISNYIPFRIISDKDVNIRVSSPNAFTVSSKKVNYFFIAFQVGNWFNHLLPLMREVELGDLTNGVLVISDQSSRKNIRNILDQFENNLDASCKSAPSNNGDFEEDDVDDHSSSGPF